MEEDETLPLRRATRSFLFVLPFSAVVVGATWCGVLIYCATLAAMYTHGAGYTKKEKMEKYFCTFMKNGTSTLPKKGSGEEEEEGAKDRGINFLYLRGRRKGGGDTSSKSRRCRRRV